jgi:hypothetical protein
MVIFKGPTLEQVVRLWTCHLEMFLFAMKHEGPPVKAMIVFAAHGGCLNVTYERSLASAIKSPHPILGSSKYASWIDHLVPGKIFHKAFVKLLHQQHRTLSIDLPESAYNPSGSSLQECRAQTNKLIRRTCGFHNAGLACGEDNQLNVSKPGVGHQVAGSQSFAIPKLNMRL